MYCSAKTRCPSCGSLKTHKFLSELGFLESENRTTKCDCCGFTYSIRDNCTEFSASPPDSPQSGSLSKKYLYEFSNEELIDELTKRGYKVKKWKYKKE